MGGQRVLDSHSLTGVTRLLTNFLTNSHLDWPPHFLTLVKIVNMTNSLGIVTLCQSYLCSCVAKMVTVCALLFGHMCVAHFIFGGG